VLDAIKKRRSIRRYTGEAVTEDQINALLEAAMAAPSGNGLAPWEFIVVRDKDLREQLSKVHQWSWMAANAPVVFVVCGKEDVSDHWVSDCSAATENLLLQATSMGLGGVWVGIYPRTERENKLRQLLNVPLKVRILCMVPIGHPDEQKPARTGFDSAKVHYEKY
jgi:nitroreductase